MTVTHLAPHMCLIESFLSTSHFVDEHFTTITFVGWKLISYYHGNTDTTNRLPTTNFCFNVLFNNGNLKSKNCLFNFAQNSANLLDCEKYTLGIKGKLHHIYLIQGIQLKIFNPKDWIFYPRIISIMWF